MQSKAVAPALFSLSKKRGGSVSAAFNNRPNTVPQQQVQAAAATDEEEKKEKKDKFDIEQFLRKTSITVIEKNLKKTLFHYGDLFTKIFTEYHTHEFIDLFTKAIKENNLDMLTKI